MRVHLADGGGFSGDKCFEQFFGLPLELMDVRVFAKDASVWEFFHNELLSWLRMSRQPLRPVSACSGRKEFIDKSEIAGYLRRTQSFPRTRRRPDAPYRG
jgi:hypothetical protein